MSDEQRLPARAAGPIPAADRLRERRVLVVGGGSQAAGDPEAPPSNGQAISVLAAHEGAAIAVADVAAEAAQETVALVGQAGGRATAIVADAASPADCERLVDEAAEAMGGLDGVVLNVGVGVSGLGLEGTDVDAWDRVLAIKSRAVRSACCPRERASSSSARWPACGPAASCRPTTARRPA